MYTDRKPVWAINKVQPHLKKKCASASAEASRARLPCSDKRLHGILHDLNLRVPRQSQLNLSAL
jgi:hypothetical protein